MEEAEAAVEKQRNVVTQYAMHGKLALQINSVAGTGKRRGRHGRRISPAPKAMRQARLLGKLTGGGGGGGGGHGDEDNDNTMGDVRFSSSRGGGGLSSRAQK